MAKKHRFNPFSAPQQNVDQKCARCPTTPASFRIGPPARDDVIWLCGPCFFNKEGAELRIRALQKVNGDE